MEENVVIECDYYTLDRAEKIIREKDHYEWLQRQRKISLIRERRKMERNYYIKQKLIGLTVCILSILLFCLADGNLLSIAYFIGGGWIVRTREKIFVDLFNDMNETFGNLKIRGE